VYVLDKDKEENLYYQLLYLSRNIFVRNVSESEIGSLARRITRNNSWNNTKIMDNDRSFFITHCYCFV